MLWLVGYYPSDQIASHNLLNQGLFKYFLNQSFCNLISHWYGGVRNIQIKDEQFDDDNFGVAMHGHQSLLIDLVDQ